MKLPNSAARNGFFLVLVLIVIAIATMAVYSFTDLMLAYDDSAYLSGDLVQTRVNVESGAEAVRLLLAEPPELRVDYGGVYNNPQMFQAVNVSVGDDNSTPSSFSILAPGLNDEGRLAGLRFGLQNESAKLNLNALTVLENSPAGMLVSAVSGIDEADESTGDEATSDNIAVSLLLTLPGMTEDIADAILDWLDEDEEARAFGAEAEYYSTLPTPYVPKNGPVLSVEELLLVRGVTPTLLFGADANRNGVLDADEQQRFGVTVETAGSLGWAAYLTVHGAEGSKRRDGTFRVNVNQDDLEILYEELAEALENDDYATFIAAYRIAGQSNSAMSLLSGNIGGGQQAEVAGRWTADLISEFDLSGGGGTSLTQILDLVGATVTVGNGDNARTYTSPFAEDLISMGLYMPLLMDALTTQEVEVMPGRININECPAELLYGIPMLPEEAVEGIIESRDMNSDDPNRQFETWPLVEGLVTLDEMRQLTPLITCGGDIYRAQIVGYYEQSGVSSRAEVIIDATTVNPKIVLWRDLSHLGRGFDLSVLGTRSFTGLEGQSDDFNGEQGN